MTGAMVISEWHVANQPNFQGEFVAIRGRAPGFLSWILSLLGVERGIRMVATRDHISFQEGDLGGSSTRIIHLNKICSTYHGYKKPWAEAFVIMFTVAGPLAGILMEVMDSPVGGVIGFLAAITCAGLYYALNKRMTIGLVEMSGVPHQIVFKRSVLEGIDLNEQSSSHASDIIQWLMDYARKESNGPPTSSVQQGHI